jgi:hypothetical protein
MKKDVATADRDKIYQFFLLPEAYSNTKTRKKIITKS